MLLYLIAFIDAGIKEIDKTDTHLEASPANVSAEIETLSGSRKIIAENSSPLSGE